MVARDGEYYMTPFKGYRGINKRDPLSPTIFNLVVDAIILHWVKVVDAPEADAEGLVVSIQDSEDYFYANGGLATPTQIESMQREFEILAELFDRVNFRMNTWNTASMAFQPCHAPGRMLMVTYERRDTRTGQTYQEWQRMRVQ